MEISENINCELFTTAYQVLLKVNNQNHLRYQPVEKIMTVKLPSNASIGKLELVSLCINYNWLWSCIREKDGGSAVCRRGRPSNGGKNCQGWTNNTAILQGLISNMQNKYSLDRK